MGDPSVFSVSVAKTTVNDLALMSDTMFEVTYQTAVDGPVYTEDLSHDELQSKVDADFIILCIERAVRETRRGRYRLGFVNGRQVHIALDNTHYKFKDDILGWVHFRIEQ